ncbi:ferritin family protein [Dehalobacterium formicoaceticum]|uniref:Ferritin family protein n=1 Tax=Dehalobacterium formicoaceticum TaxID=51515 RepID=A0ABT1Y353_9FIRM|nr:ferritin family protein [Dehalobacterium formicoaceticum]MCR6545294.1 ferritin family protein [Dehalobacterium formicoaceticum]
MSQKEREILKKAILNENEGYQFYQLAAEQTKDPDVKLIFLSLAEDEKKHESWLRKLYQEILDQKSSEGADFTPSETDSPGIFTPDKMKKFGALEVSALHIGILMEKESMDYYRTAGKETQLPSAKELFEKLAVWEQDHLDRLEAAYEAAREEWWAQQGFSPA